MGDERIVTANLNPVSSPSELGDATSLSIGAMMEPVHAVFSPTLTTGEATEQIREIVKSVFVTYGWVCDDDGRLLGVLTMRDLLLADRSTRVDQVMIKSAFSLHPETMLVDAMREVVTRHYPIYPVCDSSGRLIGLIRGQTLFEAQAIEISAQTGTMVGVSKEERLATPWAQEFLLSTSLAAVELVHGVHRCGGGGRVSRNP